MGGGGGGGGGLFSREINDKAGAERVNEKSLSLSRLYSYKTKTLSALSRPDYIKSFLHHFPSFFLCVVPYTELPPLPV